MKEDEINTKNLLIKHKTSRVDRIREKKMHKILFSNEDQIIDVRQSTMWLTKGNISPQQEGMLTKLQDRNIYFGGLSSKCPHCQTGSRSVQHLSTHCGGMLNYEYRRRHDEVVKCLHYHFTKKYGLNNKNKLKNYQVQKVISNERVKIKSDITIVTELRMEHNKPDLMIHDYRTKEITLIEVGITNKDILANKELTKSRKYERLVNELKCIHEAYKVTIIPVIMTWNGLVINHFKRS